MALAQLLAEAPQKKKTKSVIVEFFESLSPEDQRAFVAYINTGNSLHALYRHCRTAGLTYAGGASYFSRIATRIAAEYETEAAA